MAHDNRLQRLIIDMNNYFKGQGQLEPDIERRIQTLSYNSLEEELMKLLVDESGKEAEASNRNTGGI